MRSFDQLKETSELGRYEKFLFMSFVEFLSNEMYVSLRILARLVRWGV